ncbi:MAG: glycosyltransferase [Myxococcota bacterium]
MTCDLSAGGAERLVLELCRRRASDVEVEVATVMGAGPLEDAFRDAGVPVTIGGRPRKHPGVRALARLVPAVSRADVVHTHLFAGDTWGRIAAVLARHPAVVTTEHNVDRDETWQRGVRRALAPVSRVVVAVSEAAARHVEGARDVRVVPNGVDLDRLARAAPVDVWSGTGMRLLAVGRRVPQKGFDVLVEALPEGVELAIAGEGPFVREHPRVRWLGRREDVPGLLAAADALAVPSRWEGFGIAAAEGLAAGMPVVASAVDGLVEVVGDAGLLVPPGDVAALRAALVRLRDDPALRRRLGEQGRARAARFSIDRTVSAYDAIYREVAPRFRDVS